VHINNVSQIWPVKCWACFNWY